MITSAAESDDANVVGGGIALPKTERSRHSSSRRVSNCVPISQLAETSAKKTLRDRRSENMPMDRNLRQVGFYLRDHGVVEPCLACRNTDDGRACHQENEPDEGGGHGSFEHEGRNEGA